MWLPRASQITDRHTNAERSGVSSYTFYGGCVGGNPRRVSEKGCAASVLRVTGQAIRLYAVLYKPRGDVGLPVLATGLLEESLAGASLSHLGSLRG